MTETLRQDPRIKRSRGAILAAFRELVLKSRYDELKISQIVTRARVARSTFYVHYKSKDQLLLEGLIGPFTALADAVHTEGSVEDLTSSLKHFWEHRAVAKALFAGPMRGAIHRLLVSLIEGRLDNLAGRSTTIPSRLVANQIAGGQIALILAWIGGDAPCPPDRLAESLKAQALSIAAVGHA
jgi:AcrR family transcriptional regulator